MKSYFLNRNPKVFYKRQTFLNNLSACFFFIRFHPILPHKDLKVAADLFDIGIVLMDA